MELRIQNSEPSTRKNYQSNDAVVIPIANSNVGQVASEVQNEDHLWISFSDQGILSYSNCIDNNLTIENNLTQFEFWRCLLRIVFIKNSRRFYLIHDETSLYITANVESTNSSLLSLILTEESCKYSEFEVEQGEGKLEKLEDSKQTILYDHHVSIRNSETFKYLQVTKQNRFPHLALTQQTKVHLRLYRKGKVCIENWIVNEPANYLQNGDLVLLQNADKTQCLMLQPKNELFFKGADLNIIANSNLLEIQNYSLLESPMSEVKNSNMLYALWRVCQTNSFIQSNNSLIYNRDTVVFRHCFTNICLTKSWSGQNSLSSLFDLGRDSEQGPNTQNCAFHVRNKTTFCFNDKSTLCHQPLYLQSLIELDHKFLCNFQKVDYSCIKNLKMFNQSIVSFSQSMIEFISSDRENLSIRNRKAIDIRDQKGANSLLKRTVHDSSNRNPRQINKTELYQILTVDYERLKQMVNAYSRIEKILVLNHFRFEGVCYSSFHFIKITSQFLEAIGDSLKGMADIKRRKKPILKPLIYTIYEYLINVLRPDHFNFSDLLMSSFKKLIKIDDQNTILMIFYVSKMWNLNSAIDTLIQVMPQVDEAEEQLILACIFDLIQHSSHWKREQSLKIKQMFSSLGIKIKSNQPHGLTLSSNKSSSFSILDLQQQDRKLLYYIKIAVFSEAFNETKTEFEDKEILATLLNQLVNERSELERCSRQVSSEKVWRDGMNEHNLIQKIIITFEVINYYLLSLFDCTISTLKNRRFVILNANIDELYAASNVSLQSEEEITVNSHLSSAEENSSASFNVNRNGRTSQQKGLAYRNSESTIKQSTNVYWFVNYEKPEESISSIAGEFDHLIRDVKNWDSITPKSEPLKHKIKIFTSTPKLDEDSIENQQNELKKSKKSSAKLSTVSAQGMGGLQGAQLLSSKENVQHLCFMLQVFNTLINTADIVLSAGYTTVSTICKVEQLALQIVIFICGLKNRTNRRDKILLSQNKFEQNFPRTASELVQFYNGNDSNKGMHIQLIVVKQKIGELLASINELFGIILMLKKRLIVHPAIEITDRRKLFNFEFCLSEYFSLYAILCNENSPSFSSQQGHIWGDLEIEIVTKMLNFYGGFTFGHSEQIMLLNMPTQLHRSAILNRVNASASSNRPDNESGICAVNEMRQPEELSRNYEVLNMHASCFQSCEEIVYHLEMLMLLRDSIESRKHTSNDEISIVTAQMKELLDLISRKLAALRSKINTKIQLAIMRAYEVSEKLVESVFSTVYFEYDFILGIVIFLCQNPPQFRSFTKLHEVVTYSLPLAKIFLKSLHKHLQEIIRESTVYSDTASELKEAIVVIVKVVEGCHKQLSINEFVLVAGVICEIFPNRVVSQKIYHILLEGYAQDKVSTFSSPNSKALLRKLIFNAGYKDQVTINKRVIGIESLQNEHNSHKLTASSVVNAFKTLDTFKALVAEAQSEEEKHGEKGGYNGDSSNFSQLVSNINRHIFLIFRLCENSDEINRHFTQNIIKYDSLMLIAFDSDIPLKYKIPLPMYFRNDARIYDDEVAICDYLVWIASVLKDHEYYYPQLSEYINQSGLEYEDFHHHSEVKFLRQRQLPKVSLLIEQMNQRKEEFGTSSALISTVNAKIVNNQCYYWYLLFSRPFLHKQEGMLVLLEEIISNLKQYAIKKETDSQKQTINKSIVQIYEALVQLYRKLSEMCNKMECRDSSENESSISNLLLRKIKKNLKLIFEKYPSLRQISIKDIRSNENIAHSIAEILISNNLLRKFIKIFYYNEYKNIDLSIFCDKKRNDNESDTSEQTSLTFKHSRSSKMSHSGSKDSFRIAEMAIMKLTRKDVSIKYFDYQEDEGCRSNQALVLNGERNISRRSTHLPSTIKENNNHLHYFEERAYMFYEVSKLLARVCQLVQDPTLKSKLEEEFILFFQAKGTSKILKYSIVEKLKFRREMYLKQFSNELVGHQQNGLVKQLQWSPQIKVDMSSFSSKQIQGGCLISVVKSLMKQNQVKMTAEFLKSIYEESKFQTKGNEHESVRETQLLASDHFQELEQILNWILTKSANEPERYSTYLPVLKYLLLVFLSPQKTSNPEVLAHQCKISSFLADFISKFLLIISKFHEKRYSDNSEASFERQFRHKRETIITHATRMRNSNSFTNYRMPDQEEVLPFRKRSTERKEKVKYLPDLQLALYQTIDLYAIVEARTTLLQRQIYQIISTKILKMVYGMTLTSSLKLILRCLLQKCELGNNLFVPNIINSNQKLQHFVWSKIREVNDNKNLMSSNMAISENLSFISIFYDYLYSLYWDFLNSMHDHQSPSFELPKLGGEIWEAICCLEQNVARLLLHQKAVENSVSSKLGFLNLKIASDDKTSEDHERFCLLHKILSQSINLFNMKSVAQTIEKQTSKAKRMSSERLEVGQDYIIESLSTFIESRKAVYSQSSSESLSQRQVQTYTMLYSNLRHLQIRSATRILFSYVNDSLSCRSIYRDKEETSSSVHFYKKYKQDWNTAVNEILDEGKTAGQSHELQVNKIFLISEYALGQIKETGWLRMSWNNQMAGQILLGLQLLLTIISLVLFYLYLYDELDPSLAAKAKRLNFFMLIVNLALFLLFCANRLLMIWKIERLKSFVQTNLQSGTESSRICTAPILCRLVQSNFSFLLIVVFQLAIKIASIYINHLIPLQLFAVILYFDKQSAHHLRIFYVFFRASWIFLLLCLLIIWMSYEDQTTRAVWVISPDNIFGPKVYEDAEITKFIKKLSGRSGALILNWFSTIVENVLIVIFCLAMLSSVFSQLHWSIRNKQIHRSKLDSQNCIICQSTNLNHIAYVHNVIKLIDLLVNLKMRTPSSLTCAEIYLKQKMSSKDLSILDYKQHA